MKNKLMTISKIACLALVAATLAAAPSLCRAEDSTNAPAATTPAPKKQHGQPYHGNVASVDAAAMTFTVGNTTISVSSTTKIVKDGKPAVFSDVTVGEAVSGYIKKDDQGKATAVSVRIGQPKHAAAAAQ
jgi:hypothetical protein